MSKHFNIQNNHGVSRAFLDAAQIASFADRFKTYDPTPVPEGMCYGVDINHPDFDWFNSKFFPLIQQYTGNNRIRLVFGMYADFNTSFGIHQDIKQIPDNDPNALQFASFLIPISVDYTPDYCNKNATIIFNRFVKDQPDKTYKQWHDLVPAKKDLAYLHDCSAIYYWSPGSIIWWNSLVYHCGVDMPAANISSKQMFVIHTYVK